MSESIKWSTIVQKARNNPDFMEQLMKDPKTAIEQAAGVKLPDDVNFHIHRQSSKDVHLVLPLHVTEPDLAKDNAVYLEPDDGSNDGLFLGGAASADKAVYLEPDDGGQE